MWLDFLPTSCTCSCFSMSGFHSFSMVWVVLFLTSDPPEMKPFRHRNSEHTGFWKWHCCMFPSHGNPGGRAGVFTLWPIPAINGSIKFQVDEKPAAPTPTLDISDPSVKTCTSKGSQVRHYGMLLSCFKPPVYCVNLGCVCAFSRICSRLDIVIQ